MDSDDDADDTGGDGCVEEREDSDEEEDDENESEGSSDDESLDMENLIRCLKANDETLSHVCIRSDVLHQVCAAVQENSNISLFSIDDGYGDIVIDQNAASVITTVFARMPQLSEFSVIDCSIDFEAVSMLSTFLSDKGSMRSVRWCGCNLGDRGAQVIAVRLSGNTDIQEIILPRNNIRDDGAIAIASLVESNDSITKVDLSGNKIGAKGARRLAQAIVHNQRLEVLHLYDNTQACADAASDAFKKALYNDESIETIISRSNHTLKFIFKNRYGVNSLIDVHRDGPGKAMRTKIIRFLNEQPTSLLSANLDLTLMPPVLHKVGRDCLLNTMFELVRNMPDLLWNLRKRSNDHCRKRFRLS